MIPNEIEITEFLSRYGHGPVTYCANTGNAGDAIIAHATYRLFQKLGIEPEIIHPEEVVSDRIIFYSGGGNLVEGKYTHASRFIQNNYQQNREIVILPHTVYGNRELLLKADNLTILCREKKSYDYLSSIGFPEKQFFLAHDLAFTLKTEDFSEFNQECERVYHCFRTDSESLRMVPLPADNIDISLSWNGPFWHRPEFAELVTQSLACYLGNANSIHTDRLHIAILGAIMGKHVFLYPNNYYKIKAVYDYSMKDRFPNVTFVDLDKPVQPLRKPGEQEQCKELLKRYEKRIDEQNTQIKVLQEHQSALFQLYNSRSWKITRPLRAMAQFFGINKKLS